MKKIVITLIVLLVGVNVYAVDVFEFDIKGIKLGMSKSEVLKKMPCSNPKINQNYVHTIKGERLYNTSIECDTKFANLYLVLDRYDKVYVITREVRFEVEPSWHKIKKQIINHYGQTLNVLPYTKFKAFDMCWGGCSISSSGFYYQTLKNKKQLVIYGNHNGRLYLSFKLEDPKQENINYKWYKKEENLYEKQKKEKASNIDF